MTKSQMKEKYIEWNISITKLNERKYEIFNELQELCVEKGVKQKWCNMEKMIEELIKTGNAREALNLMEEYYKIEGQNVALENFSTITNDFN